MKRTPDPFVNFAVLTFFVFLIFSCNPVNNHATGSKFNDQKNASGIQNKKKVLLIIAEDRSGSTKNEVKLSENDYKNLFNIYNEKFCGQIDVRVIGNPAPEQNRFYTLEVTCPDSLKNIPENAKLNEKATLKIKNKQIIEKNKRIQEENKTNIEKFVSHSLANNVVNYKPNQGNDKTNLVDFLIKLQEKINEPTFKNYDRIDVLIISDGKHDFDKRNIPEKLNISNKNVTFFLIGWTGENPFGEKIERFSDVNGFIEYYKTL